MTDEFQSVIQGKCALPLVSRIVIKLTGEDRVRFFNGQTTQDIVKCETGTALQSAICSAKGKLQGEAVVARDTDCLIIDFPESLQEILPGRIEKYIIADDVEISEAEAPAGAVHFLGETPPELSHEWKLFKSNRFRTPGWDCWSQSATNDQLDFPVASPAIAEHFRIEFFVPKWETDIESDSLAPEFFSQDHAIRYDKGCYIGQEVIARIKSRGRVNRKCCQLKGPEPAVKVPCDIISSEGKVIGRLTSCQETALEDDRKLKAIATLQASHNEPGTEITLAKQIWKVLQTV